MTASQARIILVEDSRTQAQVLSKSLQDRGYEVTVAVDGLEALRKIRESAPDLVISDIDMPNVNGFELTRQLRERHQTARLPIILLSDRKKAEDVLSGYREGADDYIAKPVDIEILQAKVETLLRRTRAAGRAEPHGGSGRVVFFLHGKGGVGGTALAVNAAVVTAETTPYRAALLDLNVEFPSVAMLLDLPLGRTLTTLGRTVVSEVDDTDLAGLVGVHPSGVKVMIGSDEPKHAELVSVGLVQRAIEWLRLQCDYLFIDAPASFSELNLAAIDVADLICVVTAAHLPSLKATRDCLEVLADLGLEEKILLIANHTTAGGIENHEMAKFLARKLDFVVPHTPLFDVAGDEGKPLVTSRPEAPGVAVIRKFSAGLVKAAPPASP